MDHYVIFSLIQMDAVLTKFTFSAQLEKRINKHLIISSHSF